MRQDLKVVLVFLLFVEVITLSGIPVQMVVSGGELGPLSRSPSQSACRVASSHGPRTSKPPSAADLD